MISKDEIKKMADLARIDISEEEAQNLSGEMDSILDYVKQVQLVSGDFKGGVDIGSVINVMREDTLDENKESFTESVLREAPQKENGYIKVKKIL